MIIKFNKKKDKAICLCCKKCKCIDFTLAKHYLTQQQLVLCNKCGHVNGQCVDLTQPLTDLSQELGTQ